MGRQIISILKGLMALAFLMENSFLLEIMVFLPRDNLRTIIKLVYGSIIAMDEKHKFTLMMRDIQMDIL